MLFDGIILTSCLQINEERTNTAIYYLLKGKRSIQTVQDANLYGLEKYYGVYKTLDKKTFEQKIDNLVGRNFLTNSNHLNTYKLTEQGKKWLQKNEENLSDYYFNGLRYCETGEVFFERLLLLIQVLTNSKMNNSSYIPAIDKTPTMKWVKQYYKKIMPNINDELENIYKELSSLLNYCSNQQAGVFIDRLTGFKSYGLSINQLAVNYKVDVHVIQLMYVSIVHKMLAIINEDLSKYLVMSNIVKDLSTNGFITESANKTYELINKQHSLEKIAQLRKLKLNTIYDHIVEITLYDPNFSIQPYADKTVQQEIMHAVNETSSKKMRDIKSRVSEKISYFQIRLTLAAVNSRK